MKFRIPRYIWIVAVLALGLTAFVAGREVWGRTDQRSGAAAPTRPADQRQGEQQRQGPRSLTSLPPGGWEWWKDPEFKKELQLTDAQSAKINAIYQARQREYLPYDAEFEKQLIEGNRMAAERTATVDQFAVQVSRIESLRIKLLESRAVMLYRMSKELTPEQYKKMQDYRERRQSRGRGGPR